jgi:hypothetical protein
MHSAVASLYADFPIGTATAQRLWVQVTVNDWVKIEHFDVKLIIWLLGMREYLLKR